MLRRARRFFALPLLALLTLFLGGCGGSSDKPSGPELPQQVADDVAASFAALAASDSGGWYSAVEVAFATTPRLTPQFVRAHGPSILSGDTTFVRGSMNWGLNYTYYDAADAPHATFDSTTVRVTAQCTGTGRIPLAGGAGFSQHYVHVDTLTMDNLPSQSIEFGGFSNVDTAFIQIGAAPRLYFTDNLVEYSFILRRDIGSAFPDSGQAEIDGFVDVLDSPERADRSDRFDIAMVITFDGTQTPLAEVKLNIEQPKSIYRYRINLKTGAVTPN